MESNFYIPEKIKEIAPVIWEQKTDMPQRWKMLPEFNLDLIFNLDQPWTVYSAVYKERSFNPTEKFCFLSGLHTKPLYVEFQHCHMFGIRLNTIAANILFGLPCSELKNWSLEGDEVLKNKIDFLEDKIRSLPDFHSRAVWLEEFIFLLIKNDSDFGLALKISHLLEKLSQQKINDKQISIENYTGYSRMHTNRIFKKWVGLSPSETLLLKQFVYSISLIHTNNHTLTQIALESGYYDQPHFIRVFKKFAEMTPKQYLKQKTNLVGQLPF